MADFWSFLLQTLTASGVAVLLLLMKAMFRDKLSPRWQFTIWGVLGVILLLPAGMWGRYTLFHWPFYVELLRSSLTGEYGSLALVTAPIPLPSFTQPKTLWDWLYLIYVAGVAFLLLRYLSSYIRLRLILRRGRPAKNSRVQAVAAKYGLPVCPSIEVDGLSSAFVCGIFRPVLTLPAAAEIDDKVLLHELLHLKHKDILWGWATALFRCLHWCNPLLWLCANLAGNDLESLCDQRVLERLEGDFGDTISLGGGGGHRDGFIAPPDAYAADFYWNGEKKAELTLLPVKGGLEVDWAGNDLSGCVPRRLGILFP